MDKRQLIDANSGRLMEFDFDNTVFLRDYLFKDQKDSKYKFNFEYRIIELKKQPGFVIIIQYWQQNGLVFDNPMISLQKLHSVVIVNDMTYEEANRKIQTLYSSDGKSINQSNVFLAALLLHEMPIKVFNYFLEEIRKEGLVDLELTSYE